jgi:hypothetical protein
LPREGVLSPCFPGLGRITHFRLLSPRVKGELRGFRLSGKTASVWPRGR